ncbi:MAG TPA: VWA domain-containing protein [Bryobacteraceae bacterium]|nr:VWA domain-containing protein [Bryobacteraceae bacterium]
MRIMLCASALCWLATTLAAQQSVPADELTVHVLPYAPLSTRTPADLLEVPVVVRDAKGAVIAGLTRQDFEIRDSGQKREIATFSSESLTLPAASGSGAGPGPLGNPLPFPGAVLNTDLPTRFIALVFDDLNTDAAGLTRVKAAAAKFVSSFLSPGDAVGIFTTSRAGIVMFTADLEKLTSSIASVSPNARHSGEDARLNADDTLVSIGRVVATMSRMPGRHVVILASSGFSSAQEESRLEAVTSSALHSRIVINTLNASEAAESGDALAILASATGGEYVPHSSDLSAGLHRLEAVPDVIYILGLPAAGDGKYHSLEVRLAKGHRGIVQALIGYRAPSERPDQAEQEGRDRVLLGTDSPSDVAAEIQAEPDDSESGLDGGVQASIDVTRLHFEKEQDRRKQKVRVIAALFDKQANFVTGRQAEAEMALKDASFESLASQGLTISLSLHAPPGFYNLRVLVQEATSEKMTAVTRAITIQ